MREKQLRLVVAFHTTTAAMAIERYCNDNQIAGRLIPIPREITAGCGLAWSAPITARADVERAAAAVGAEIDGYYELMLP